MTQAPLLSASLGRRGFLSRKGHVQRPPWTTEASVRESCTSCGDCIRACPEAILIPGPAGTPGLDFTRGECTFCADCANACGEDVFFDITEMPWTLTAEIGSACLLTQGVSCRACSDFCETEALRFDLRAGPVGTINVDAAACTGCGACVAACPVGTITVSPEEQPAKEPVA